MEEALLEDKKPRGYSKIAVGATVIVGGLTIGLTAVSLPFVAPAARKVCLPYVPATTQQIANVLKALGNRTGTLVDIGSGDGRVVLAAAKTGAFKACGIELNPWLSWYSSVTSWRQGLSDKASFTLGDLWRSDLSRYDNIVVFGVPSLMGPLEKKLSQEMTKDARLLTCRFPLQNWTPISVYGDGFDAVWVYKKPINTQDVVDSK